jgi:hypothetical protein
VGDGFCHGLAVDAEGGSRRRPQPRRQSQDPKDDTNMTPKALGPKSLYTKYVVRGGFQLPDLDSNQEPAG